MKRGSTTPATAWPTALVVPPFDAEKNLFPCGDLLFVQLPPLETRLDDQLAPDARRHGRVQVVTADNTSVARHRYTLAG